MKKVISTSIILIMLATALTVVLCACTSQDYSLVEVVAPDTLPTSQLQLDWLYTRQSGAPTMIYFEDAQSSYSPTTLTFPTGLRGVESSEVAAKSDNLWEYWRDNGYNVAVFRVENFVVGDNAVYYKKLVDATATTWVNADGSAGEGKLNCDLVDAFVSRYVAALKTEADKYAAAETTAEQAIPDTRFVGSGVGALFATYAAEALYNLYEAKAVSEYYLPSRVAIINPYFTQKSVLTTAADSIEYIAARGVAIEYIESDKDATVSYITSELDLYNRIIAQCAFLQMRDTYSAGLAADVKEKIAMTWYLVSVNGSDYHKLGNAATPTTKYQRYPVYNMPELYYNTFNNYGVSAWTPTVFTRLLRGATFSQQYYDYSTNKATDYYSSSFRTELYQYADKASFRVGGYVFNDVNGDACINDGAYSQAIAGAVVTLTYSDEDDAEPTVIATTKTDSTGFYSFNLTAEQYNVVNRLIYVKVAKPNYKYVYSSASTSYADNEAMSYSTIGADGATVGNNYTDYNRMSRTNKVFNCGLRLG